MMEEFQHILVPVDGSEPSVRVLEKAVYLAEKCGSQVTLLTVVDMNKEINSFEQVSTGGYVPGELKEKGYQILLKLMPSIPRKSTSRPSSKSATQPRTSSSTAKTTRRT